MEHSLNKLADTGVPVTFVRVKPETDLKAVRDQQRAWRRADKAEDITDYSPTTHGVVVFLGLEPLWECGGMLPLVCIVWTLSAEELS